MQNSTKIIAAKATLHCLLGCIIGELIGLEIGRLAGLSSHLTVLLAGGLAFVSGYLVSTLPLLRHMSFIKALRLVFVADTLSIATMVIVDNALMLVMPGAMGSDPLTLTYWTSRLVSLAVAFLVAWPVNAWQLRRGRGHALTHHHHNHHSHHSNT